MNSKSKIVYIATARMPTEKAHGLQITKMCEAFGLGGAEVELILPKRKNSISQDIFEYYNAQENFKITYLPCQDKKPYTKYRVWRRDMSFLRAARKELKNKEFDFIYTRDKFILPLAKKHNLFYEIHDFPQGQKWFYRKYFKKLSGIVTTNNWKKQEIIKQFKVPENRILAVSNGVDVCEFDIDIDRQEARQRLHLPLDKKIVLYSGHFYNWKGTDVLLEAAKQFSDALFIFVGGGEQGKENILVTGRKPHKEIPLWLKVADALVLPNTGKQDISRYWTSPIKMFEYMASERPIVASDLPSIREVLNEDNAILVEPDNDSALAIGIKKVLSNPELANKIAKKAFEDVQEFTWTKRAEKIMSFIRKRTPPAIKFIAKTFDKVGLTKKITRPRLNEFIAKHSDASGLTLDLGCGQGYYRRYFPNRIGVDIKAGEAVDVVADAHQLPFGDEKFDNILCSEVLEHLHTPKRAVSEMKRVLKKGGRLILTTRFIFPIHDAPHDYYRFTKYGLRHLFSDWQILELKAETNTLEAIAVLLQRIGYQTEILNLKLLKVPLFLTAHLVKLFSGIITKEYGDISKKNPEKDIISSGYYLVAKKQK